MKFFTPAEKLKTTRKYLKLKQGDLSDSEISRGLISMIEIGQRGLSKNIAHKIVKKFRNRAKELGIALEIDEDFLMRSPMEDAEFYCLKKLEEIDSDEGIEEILEISNKYNLIKIKALAYKKVGNYYLNCKKDYKKAIFSFFNSADSFKDINENNTIPELYFKIGICKAELLQYDEALSFFSLSKSCSIMYNDEKIKVASTYNVAKCFKKLNKIDLAIQTIKKYISIVNKEEDFNHYVYANILKANCYEIKGNIDTVIDIYDNLFTEIQTRDSHSNLIGYVYNNLGLAYLKNNDFDKSLEYFDMAEQFRIKFDPKNLCCTLIEKSDLFIKQELYSEAIKLINTGLIQAKSNSNYEYMLKGNFALAHIYEKFEDTLNLKQTYLVIVDLLKMSNKINELVYIYGKLSLLCLNDNNISDVKKYLLMSQKFSVKCCNNDV